MEECRPPYSDTGEVSVEGGVVTYHFSQNIEEMKRFAERLEQAFIEATHDARIIECEIREGTAKTQPWKRNRGKNNTTRKHNQPPSTYRKKTHNTRKKP